MIAIEGLAKRYGKGDLVLRHVSLSIAEGEFFTLLGPSGCGKTTLLRCIAGLEQAEGGSIAIRTKTVFDAARGLFRAPNHRNIGMVFQSYAIWPHMTVVENVAFPARVRGFKSPIDSAVKALRTVGLEHLKHRSATQLSGGQQQRVALARAIATAPDVLLLDEPLSNLDAGLRDQMRGELRRLQTEIGVTTILVTHDQAEALSLSDTIAVMDQGEVVEVGSPEVLYQRPSQAFTARFLGEPAEIPVEVKMGRGGRLLIEAPFGVLPAPLGAPAKVGPATLFLRTERLELRHEQGDTDTSSFPAQVLARRFLGSGYEYDLRTFGNNPILFRVKNSARLVFDAGSTIQIEAPDGALILIPRNAETP